MRELRFVAADADTGHLIVVDRDSDEQFRLLVDGPLRTATVASPAEAVAPPPDTDALSVREIQVRVRSGESPQALSDESGWPLDRILVFAGPVLDERERIVDEARRGRANRGPADPHLVILGETVDRRFSAHGVDPGTVQWEAARRDDGSWLISATWRAGDVDRTAQWSFALAARTSSAVDDTASDLLSDRPIRPLAVVAADPPLGSPRPDAVRPLPPEPEQQASADADTGPLPAVQPESAATAASEPTATEDALPLAFPAGTLPDPVPTERSRRPTPATRSSAEETEEQRAARARIPSWDDIMLGVRRKRD